MIYEYIYTLRYFFFFLSKGKAIHMVAVVEDLYKLMRESLHSWKVIHALRLGRLKPTLKIMIVTEY